MRGPGYARFPRHVAVRVNDLVAADVSAVVAQAARRGLPVGDRTVPVSATPRAVVTPTAAGTVITLERLTGARHGRRRSLRALTRELDSLVTALDTAARGSRKPR